jgi:endoglycosylceramidase
MERTGRSRNFNLRGSVCRMVVIMALAMAGLSGSALAAMSAAPAARIGHAGRWITDGAGRVVVVHGFNMVYKLPPYYPAAAGFGADDAAFLERLGFNVVRVGVIWKAVEPRPGVYDDEYLRHIAGTVRTLAEHGVFSLLDFHQDMYNELFQGEGAPDWAVQDDELQNPKKGFPFNYLADPALQRAEDHFWANSPGPGGVGLQDRYAATWRHVAQTFRSIPGVLGYELLNEPSAGTQFEACLGASGCPAFDAELTAFDRRVASAIRTVDRHTLIFHEPDVGFDFGVATRVPALRHGPAGFAFHDYCLAPSPNGCTSEPRGITNAVGHVAHTHEALLMTEWGSNPYRGDLTGMINLADRYMVPWIEWAYCPCGDPTGATPDPLVLDPAAPPVGANVGQLALHILVEPFPQLIAGTPLAWGYSQQTKTFQLRYSTAKVGGHGRFAAGALTEVATPRVIYARPYAVRVRGGAVVSRPGAGILEVAACPGARTISVQVLPSGRDRESCRPTGA